jgi:hypothetical protein
MRRLHWCNRPVFRLTVPCRYTLRLFLQIAQMLAEDYATAARQMTFYGTSTCVVLKFPPGSHGFRCVAQKKILTLVMKSLRNGERKRLRQRNRVGKFPNPVAIPSQLPRLEHLSQDLWTKPYRILTPLIMVFVCRPGWGLCRVTLHFSDSCSPWHKQRLSRSFRYWSQEAQGQRSKPCDPPQGMDRRGREAVC